MLEHIMQVVIFYDFNLTFICLKIDGAEGTIPTKVTKFGLGNLINISCEIDGEPPVSEVVWIFNNKSIQNSEWQVIYLFVYLA